MNLELEEGDFAPGTTYNVTVYSTPRHLGIFQTNTDGSIQQEVSFKGVPHGHHMLVLEGTGVDGQPVKVYQFIEVHATQNDADGDGIPNDEDRCHFISYLYDQNGSDVCMSSTKIATGNKKNIQEIAVGQREGLHNTTPLETHSISSVTANNGGVWQNPIRGKQGVVEHRSKQPIIHSILIGGGGVFAVVVATVVVRKAIRHRKIFNNATRR